MQVTAIISVPVLDLSLLLASLPLRSHFLRPDLVFMDSYRQARYSSQLLLQSVPQAALLAVLLAAAISGAGVNAPVNGGLGVSDVATSGMTTPSPPMLRWLPEWGPAPAPMPGLGGFSDGVTWPPRFRGTPQQAGTSADPLDVADWSIFAVGNGPGYATATMGNRNVAFGSLGNVMNRGGAGGADFPGWLGVQLAARQLSVGLLVAALAVAVLNVLQKGIQLWLESRAARIGIFRHCYLVVRLKGGLRLPNFISDEALGVMLKEGGAKLQFSNVWYYNSNSRSLQRPKLALIPR